MHTFKKALILASLATPTLAFGQTSTTTAEAQPYIEVTGTAEQEVIPNEIYIGITIRERYVNKTKVTIEEQEEKLRNSVKSLGIDLKNLYLSDANADYVKVRWQKKDVLTKKDYTLKVGTTKALAQVFQELEKLEITDASIARVNHSSMDSLRREVRIHAIKTAKNKADYLLTAIGEQTGRALVIKENEISQSTGMPYRAIIHSNSVLSNVNADKMTSEDDDGIPFQKIKVQISIYAKFAIKPKPADK